MDIDRYGNVCGKRPGTAGVRLHRECRQTINATGNRWSEIDGNSRCGLLVKKRKECIFTAPNSPEKFKNH